MQGSYQSNALHPSNCHNHPRISKVKVPSISAIPSPHLFDAHSNAPDESKTYKLSFNNRPYCVLSQPDS
jgi:hypothetical protein